MGKTSPVLHATWRPFRDLCALCDLSLVVLGRKGRKVSAKYAKVAAGVGIAQVCDARNDERNYRCWLQQQKSLNKYEAQISFLILTFDVSHFTFNHLFFGLSSMYSKRLPVTSAMSGM